MIECEKGSTTSEMKYWPTEVVLSMYGSRLLCPFDKLQEFAEYLQGGPVWTHQMPRVAEESRSSLLRDCPRLAEYDDSGCTRASWKQHRDDWIRRLGVVLRVGPIPKDDLVRRGPVGEAVEMFGADKVVVVEVGGE